MWLDTFCVAELNICHISFHMTWMGVADWVESHSPKMALAVASCSFAAKANWYDWRRWTAREHFRVLLSNETVAYLLKGVDATFSTPSYCQAHQSKKLVLGCNCNKHIVSLLRLGSTGEYLVLSFCIGPPYGWADTASLEPNILLYCPSTCTIMSLPRACMRSRGKAMLSCLSVCMCVCVCRQKIFKNASSRVARAINPSWYGNNWNNICSSTRNVSRMQSVED